ncbi:unnamed protein product [Cylicostephanus goldi]|uniref:Uncharacterized protein n=1 Tax=Cylicostephanus goldi TaxID=71465 RepID=A0A3P7MXW7_CYLGO|nr:unnamed protein product [Cylicostephanus goldi]
MLLPSFESVNNRPEMTSLPPVMLMPSVDPEVIHLQKELLLRQLRLQRMQEKVLQAQFNTIRLPIASTCAFPDMKKLIPTVVKFKYLEMEMMNLLE